MRDLQRRRMISSHLYISAGDTESSARARAGDDERRSDRGGSWETDGSVGPEARRRAPAGRYRCPCIFTSLF